eukprot:846601-Alexandrium_andersonii.AAC.1
MGISSLGMGSNSLGMGTNLGISNNLGMEQLDSFHSGQGHGCLMPSSIPPSQPSRAAWVGDEIHTHGKHLFGFQIAAPLWGPATFHPDIQ